MTKHRRQSGFTLIELLIVIVVIGILALIGMGRYQQSRENAYMRAVQSDLRSLVPIQEFHFFNANVYSDDAASLDFVKTPEVEIEITFADAAGWGAVATHQRLVTYQCGVFMGQAPEGVAEPAEVPGIVTCQ